MNIKFLTMLITTTSLIATEGASSFAADFDFEEIIVTAQKRSQKLQDIPISVTAFSEQNLRDQGVARIDDFANFIPNVHYNPNSSIRNSKITIRGIVSDSNSIGVEQAAGVYVDGIYMGRPTMINVGVYDLERVEVLRGPQGTLYGKNTVAGAISMFTRKPTNEFEGEALISYGNYNRIVAFGSLSGPLIEDKLAIRVTGQTEQRDGYIKNLAGHDQNDANNYNARMVLAFTPNDNLEIILRGDYARDRTYNGGAELAIVAPVYAGAPFNVTPGTEFYVPDDAFDRVIAEDSPSFQNRNVWGASLEINWELESGGTITSLTGYRGFNWENFQSAETSPFDILGSGIEEDQEQFSQELRFTSATDEEFEYIAGLYYFRTSLDAVPSLYGGEDIFS